MSDATSRLTAALEGRYTIERELGEGGMATVYLATDLKHNRSVALKVLKSELAAVVGAERFLAEIETTANLQHPHILPLHDSGEADGFLYYVMPYIEGETLRERIEREKQLPVDEAVRIASDVAEALHAAHEQGVIHRDIKPANILLSRGRPLVADFGIALAVSAAGGGRLTETGLSMGTPFYMSPEQASADRDPTAVSDVYSLGCVLYEMLIGDPPYTASSAQAVLAKILTEDVRAPTTLRRSIPENVDAAIRKALEKLPADRFGTADGFVKALGDTAFRHGSVTTEAGAPARGDAWNRLTIATTAVAAVATAVALWGFLGRAPRAQPSIPTRTEVLEEYRLLRFPGRDLAISPDGRWFAAVAVDAPAVAPPLQVRSATDPEWRALLGTDLAIHPSFSPDGQAIAFGAGGRILTIPTTGGPTTSIAAGAGPHWGGDNTIVFVRDAALYRIPGHGGESELLFDSDTIAVSFPHLLPGGSAVLFSTPTAGDPVSSRIMLFEIESGDVRELVASGNQPEYAHSGHLLFGHGDGALMAVRFDLDDLRTEGNPIVVIPSLAVGEDGTSQFAVSRHGTLIYAEAASAAADAAESNPLRWLDFQGSETTIPIPPSIPRTPRISPDGDRIAYSSQDHVWIYHLREERSQQFTFTRSNQHPLWSPDGQTIYYLSRENPTESWIGFRRAADGASEAEQLWEGGDAVALTSLGRDERWLIVAEDSGTGLNISRVDLDEEVRTLEPLLHEEFLEYEGVISPDGRWLAYTSNERGVAGGVASQSVYVTGFPEPQRGVRWSVSQGEAFDPVWAPDGSALYYASPTGLMKVDVERGDTFIPGAPTRLFTPWDYDPAGLEATGYDLHPDGDRFLAVRNDEGSGARYVVVSWFTELLERMGEN